jgi:hypothetical protein
MSLDSETLKTAEIKGWRGLSYKSFYSLSLLTVVLASAYPLYMGITTLNNYFQNGFIDVADYKKYIIPYTPISIALIISVALLPVIFKLAKRYTLPVVSLLGTVIFFVSELGFEQIKVIEGYVEMPLESWQLSLCIATPEVLRSIGEPIYAANNPVFKIHFYIIAIVIILALLHVIYGFSRVFREREFGKIRPLTAQAVSVIVFIALCILACFTAFYRNGTLNISPLSALLMSIYFIVFGVTAGIYCSTIFYKKSRLLSQIFPALCASLATFIMYIGEMMLMDGILFKYGNGFLFEPIGAISFSPVDIVIVLASGLLTYTLSYLLNHRKISTNVTVINA